MPYDPDDPYGGIPQLTGPLPGADQSGLVDPGLWPTFPDSTDVVGDDPFGGIPQNAGLPGSGSDGIIDVPSVGGSGGGNGFSIPGLGGIGDKLKKLNPKQIAALAALAQALFRGRGQSMADLLKQNPSLDATMKLQASQAQRQDPLHKAVTQLATNLLPNSAFGAGPNRPLIG